MSNLKIKGKLQLSGEVKTSGNKNAALACLAASLLLPVPVKEEVFSENPRFKITFHNLPRIRDVNVFMEILERLGMHIYKFNKGNSVEVRKEVGLNDKTEVKISPEEARKIRASVLLLGPLLRLYQKVTLPQPGGCKIGPRPIDTHLEAFHELGMGIKENEDGSYCVERDPEREDLAAQEILLRETSVTVTENILLFAAGNRKNSLVIRNAACEPHVETLCRLLNSMGAKISGIGTNVLSIEACKGFNRERKDRIVVEIEPDYIEAITFAVAAAITKSDITIKNIEPKHLVLAEKYLRKMGVKSLFSLDLNGSRNWQIFGRDSELKVSHKLKELKAEPWYGLPTDSLPLFLVLATQCEGELELIDYMYNGRLINLANALNNMGADIKILGNRGLLVKGPTPLKSRVHLSPDLRNGVGLVLAGLCAEGETIIQNFEIVERGYEKLPEKLISLNAKAEVV